jgi:hypothetical protein
MRQIEANRRNAEKSTGPKTVKGKAKVAGNLPNMSVEAMMLLANESPEEFVEFERVMRADLRPGSPLEEAVYRQLVHQMWRVQRASRSEVAFWDLALDDARDRINRKYGDMNDPGKVAVAFNEATQMYPAFPRLGAYEERAQRVALRLLDQFLRLKRMTPRRVRGED